MSVSYSGIVAVRVRPGFWHLSCRSRQSYREPTYRCLLFVSFLTYPCRLLSFVSLTCFSFPTLPWFVYLSMFRVFSFVMFLVGFSHELGYLFVLGIACGRGKSIFHGGEHSQGCLHGPEGCIIRSSRKNGSV